MTVKQPQTAKNKILQNAIKLLATREHSRMELQRKLANKGFSATSIATTLQKLAADGWQSDERFAESYIALRIKSGYGPVKIAYELSNRGIAPEIVHKYLPQESEYWQKQAIKVYNSKFSAKENDYKTRAKQMCFLQSRGFTTEQINFVFKDV